MTNRRVDFDFRDGVLGGVDGIVRAYPTKRFLLEVDDEIVVVLPEAVEIPIVDGLGSVELLPNDPEVWTWMFVESFGRGALTRWCHVIDADGQRYGELTEIDPTTYDAVVDHPTIAQQLADISDQIVEAGINPGAEHHQDVPAATWIFPYTGRIPSVSIYVGGELVDAPVTVAGGNVTVQFPAPVAGVLVLG